MEKNLQRMIQLAGEFFDVKNDPEQISVDEEVIRQLREIHPATITEERNADGPIAWILVIPTTTGVMEEFLEARIGERILLARAPAGIQYDALYLCSALVLPEFRNRGIAHRLLTNAIGAIRKDHPIQALFYWSFSPEGGRLARSAADACRLPLFARKSDSSA